MLEKILVKEIVAPILIVAIFFAVYSVIVTIIKKVTKLKLSYVDEKRKKTITNLIINIIRCVFIVVAILMILNVYSIDTTALLASLGTVSLVAGLALQDTIKDFLSGITIIFENQYSVGDTITINGFKGEVLTIGLKSTRIRAYTGEVMIIANRNIGEVINHSIEKSLAQVNFQVSYEDDINKAEKVLKKLCERLTEELENIKGEVTLLGITNLDESGINYRITVETIPLKNAEIERKILKEVKLELDKNGITIPYKQVVIRNA